MAKQSGDREIVEQLFGELEEKRCEYDEDGNLLSLNLSQSDLTEVPQGIGELTNLQRLNLQDTKLREVPRELGQLRNLQYLNLHNTELREVPRELGELTSLQILYLHNTKLREVPRELGRLDSLSELYLDGNPDLLTPPLEIVALGTDKIKEFLRELERNSIVRHESKLLLVGEGATGKSSLLRLLHDDAFDPHLLTSHGIEVDALRLPHPTDPAI